MLLVQVYVFLVQVCVCVVCMYRCMCAGVCMFLVCLSVCRCMYVSCLFVCVQVYVCFLFVCLCAGVCMFLVCLSVCRCMYVHHLLFLVQFDGGLLPWSVGVCEGGSCQRGIVEDQRPFRSVGVAVGDSLGIPSCGSGWGQHCCTHYLAVVCSYHAWEYSP